MSLLDFVCFSTFCRKPHLDISFDFVDFFIFLEFSLFHESVVGDPGSHPDDRERRNKVENNTRRQDLRGSAKLPMSTAALGIFYSISRVNKSYKKLPIYIEKKSRVLLGLEKATRTRRCINISLDKYQNTPTSIRTPHTQHLHPMELQRETIKKCIHNICIKA